MRFLLILGIALLSAGCNDGNYNRGYVISKYERGADDHTEAGKINGFDL